MTRHTPQYSSIHLPAEHSTPAGTHNQHGSVHPSTHACRAQYTSLHPHRRLSAPQHTCLQAYIQGCTSGAESMPWVCPVASTTCAPKTYASGSQCLSCYLEGPLCSCRAAVAGSCCRLLPPLLLLPPPVLLLPPPLLLPDMRPVRWRRRRRCCRCTPRSQLSSLPSTFFRAVPHAVATLEHAPRHSAPSSPGCHLTYLFSFTPPPLRTQWPTRMLSPAASPPPATAPPPTMETVPTPTRWVLSHSFFRPGVFDLTQRATPLHAVRHHALLLLLLLQ